MSLVVIRPDGLTWNGQEFKYGQKLPASVSSHENYTSLLKGGYVAHADSEIVREMGIRVGPIEQTERLRRSRGRALRSKIH